MQQLELEFSTNYIPGFDPNEWCMKNGLHSGGLNPGPLGHESSVLSTRPWLLGYRLKLMLEITYFINPSLFAILDLRLRSTSVICSEDEFSSWTATTRPLLLLLLLLLPLLLFLSSFAMLVGVRLPCSCRDSRLKAAPGKCFYKFNVRNYLLNIITYNEHNLTINFCL